MRRRVFVTGRSLLSSLGQDPTAVLEAIRAGQSGIRIHPPFAERDGIETPRDLPAEVLPEGALTTGELVDWDPLPDLGEGNLRPLDRTGRLAAAAGARALASAGWTTDTTSTIGLVLGTQYGGLRTISEFDRRGMTAGPLYVKPFEFANSVLNAAAGQAAIWHRLEGSNTTVSSGLTSGIQAVGIATDLLRSGRAQRLLAGGAEEFCCEGYCAFAAAGLLAASDAMEATPPTGTHLGEGAALLALEAAAVPAACSGRPRAEVVGSGEAFDPSPERTRDSAADSLRRAVELALNEAGAAWDELSVVVDGRDGIPSVDAPQEQLWREISSHAPSALYVSPRLALGEALGASGAQQLVLLEEALPALPPRALGLTYASGLTGHHHALLLRRLD